MYYFLFIVYFVDYLFNILDGAKITGGLRFVYNITKGTNVPIECNARGQPAPKIELFIENQTVNLEIFLIILINLYY